MRKPKQSTLRHRLKMPLKYHLKGYCIIIQSYNSFFDILQGSRLNVENQISKMQTDVRDMMAPVVEKVEISQTLLVDKLWN